MSPVVATKDLWLAYIKTRKVTRDLTAHLEPEDLNLQSMPDASPVKWHLAHTTWFFETFLIKRFLGAKRIFDPRFDKLFNSYYQSLGGLYPRPQRGLLSRPSIREVLDYRDHVDRAMAECFERFADKEESEFSEILEIGIHHEIQHQELILTDIKHALFQNPLLPSYARCAQFIEGLSSKIKWFRYDGGLREIGHTGQGFGYDNESPRHKVYLEPFEIASRLVTNGEYLEFIDDGGYERFELWLSEGWDWIKRESMLKPLYWQRRDEFWMEYTLHGLKELALHLPVSCISFYEADAYARWKGGRLPLEAEWECAADHAEVAGNLLENEQYGPLVGKDSSASPAQLFGDLWEWTSSAYRPYPGYQVHDGALGEYNGKFMANQFVLKGGSFATARHHIRASYRNFFHPPAQWQFTGIRLARKIDS